VTGAAKAAPPPASSRTGFLAAVGHQNRSVIGQLRRSLTFYLLRQKNIDRKKTPLIINYDTSKLSDGFLTKIWKATKTKASAAWQYVKDNPEKLLMIVEMIGGIAEGVNTAIHNSNSNSYDDYSDIDSFTTSSWKDDDSDTFMDSDKDYLNERSSPPRPLPLC